MSDIERSSRVQQAIMAYEAASEGFRRKRVKFEIGCQQADDPENKYWDRIVDRLENRYHLPVPDINQLAFLDLGGGNDSNGSYSDADDWKPYLVRYLAALGAPHVVNVDTGRQDPKYNDVYIHLQFALSDQNDFSLPEELERHGQLRKYDVIFSAMLVDEGNESPSLPKDINPRRLEQKIKEWAQQLLKPGGYLFLDGGFTGFVLIGDELVDIKDASKILGNS